jgi:hypothetical protein
MHVTVEASVRETQRGVLAQCKSLRLTGGGRQTDEALESLRRGVTAWCSGLRRQDALTEALQRRGIHWTPDDGPLVVEVHCQDASEHPMGMADDGQG